MLVLREDQYAAMVAGQREQFSEYALERIREDYPTRYARMGEHHTRVLIRVAIDKGEAYGLADGNHVLELIDYMLEFGPDFDHNSETAWAGEILNWRLPGTPKMSALRKRAEAQRAQSGR